MLLLTVLVVLFVLGLAGLIFIDEYRHENLKLVSLTTTILALFSLVSCVCMLTVNPYAEFYGKYINTKMVLEQTNGVITGTLKDEIVELNKEILINQQKANNIWNGIYYSEKIAKTPLIELVND